MKEKNHAVVQLFSQRTIAHICSRLLFSWKSLLVLTFFWTNVATFAQSKDQLVYDEAEAALTAKNTYRVIDPVKFTVAIVASDKTGEVVVPPQIRVKDKVFQVKAISNKGSGSYKNGITVLKLPEGLEDITRSCLAGSMTIKEVHIPSTILTVREGAFIGAHALSKIVVANNPRYEVIDDVLYTKPAADKMLVTFPAAKVVGGTREFRIPNNVKKIAASAFYVQKSIKSLHIPASVLDIHMAQGNIIQGAQPVEAITVDLNNPVYSSDMGVLYNKNKTELLLYPIGKRDLSFQVPKFCLTLGKNAIMDNHHIKSLDLNMVATLNINSIWNCGNLTSLTLPMNLQTLPAAAIGGCAKLEKFVVPAGHSTFRTYGDDGVLYSADGRKLLFVPSGKTGTYRVNENTEIIVDASFRSVKLTEVVIPSNVKKIEANAFASNTTLAKVTFEPGSQLTTIDAYAFTSCKALSEIKIPKSVTVLGRAAFANNDKLTTVRVEAGSLLKTIGGYLFQNTPLQNFIFEGTSSLQTIQANAFAYLPLKSFTFPSSLTTIERGAFLGCSELKTVTFDKKNSKISTIGEGAFAECGLTSVSLPESVLRVEREAFVGCKAIESVEFSDKTNYIHPEAFKSCSKLAKFVVDPNNKTYSSVKKMLCTANKEKLVIFPPGLSQGVVLLPPSLTEIGDYAFYDNPNLSNVTIPKKVTKIGNRAFGLCPKLTYLTLSCDQVIDPATIPQADNVTAFDNGSNVSNNQYAKITLIVRKTLLDQYKSKDYYKKFKGFEESFTVPYTHNGTSAGVCEYMPVSEEYVSLVKAPIKGVQTIVLDEVMHGGKKKKIGLIEDYAFEGATVTSVVLKSPEISYLGAMAFVTDIKRVKQGGVDVITPLGSKIKEIFFCSNGVPKLFGAKDFELNESFSEFTTTQNIYVKKSLLSKFQNEPALERVRAKIAYKIPAAPINNYYTTFSREFDVDLEDGDVNRDVHAFIGGVKKLQNGSGDVGSSVKKVSFTSIVAAGKQGTYIPANTGVLIKHLGKTPGKSFYYRIGESDSIAHSVKNNMLKPVTEKEKTLKPVTEHYYVLQQGIFRFINKSKTPTVVVPLNKAYLDLGTTSAAAELALYFEGDDDVTTALEEIKVETTSRAPYYRLDGTRVATPGKGLYIHNGKKVFLN